MTYCDGAKYLMKRDSKLSKLIREIGPLNNRPRQGRYRSLVQTIVSQGLSSKSADSIVTRLRIAAGGPITASRISAIKDHDFREIGLSGGKVKAVKELTKAVESRALRLDRIGKLSDEKVREELISISGIGPWTIHIFMMFALRRTDILPAGDVGIRNAVAGLYQLKKPPTTKEIEGLTERWRPYRTLGCRYLWIGIDSGLLSKP